MSAVVRAIGVVVLATAAGSVLFNALAYDAAARHRRRHPPDCPAADDDRGPWPARTLVFLATFATESAVAALLVLTLPLTFRHSRARHLARDDSRCPVVLVHGYLPWFLFLARRLRRDGWSHVHAVRHGTTAQLARAIAGIRDETGASTIDVVAHGASGVVAAACARRPEASCIARVVTLATRHPEPAPSADCISIYSADDALVRPPAAGYWPGAFNIEVRGVGHLSLAFSRRVYDLVHENLAATGDDRSRRWTSR